MARKGHDNLWQGLNDGFRQRAEGCNSSGLICLAGAGGKLFGVFLAPSWVGISGAASRSGFWTTTLVAHLRCQTANAVLVQQVSERTN